jgi:hypothetical protein
MPNLFKSAHLVFVASLLVGISGSTRADASEPLAPAMDPVAEVASTQCVTLTDGVLDLRVTADASDVWSIDGNLSVGGSTGEVTLQVASSSPALTVRVWFQKLSDTAKIIDEKGVQTMLVPTSTRSAVEATVSENLFTLFAAEATTINPGATNKAVIKRVTTCPT